jgi:SHAQKYF class myb-like DNA-binding protein
MSEDNEEIDLPKKRGHWSKDEHNRFVDGLRKHGKDWKKIVECVGTRSSNQVRSHAQKYFLKLEKKSKSPGVLSQNNSDAYLMYLQTMSYNAYMRFMFEMQKIFSTPFTPETKPVKIVSGQEDISDEQKKNIRVS